MIQRVLFLLGCGASLICFGGEPKPRWFFFVYACADQPTVTREVSKSYDGLVSAAERHVGAQFLMLYDPSEPRAPATTIFVNGGTKALTLDHQPEVNMGASETLAGFLRAGAGRIRAENRVALLLLGHGVGWGASDLSHGVPSMCLDYSHNNDGLTPCELGDALRRTARRLPRERFDVVIVHACAQGSLELAWEVAGTTDFLVAAPGLLGAETPNYIWLASKASQMAPRELARAAARKSTLLGGPMAACDLAQIGSLRDALASFCEAAIRLARRDPAFARSRVFDWALPLPSQPSATEAVSLFRYVANDPYVSSELQTRARKVSEILSSASPRDTPPFLFLGARAGMALAIPDKKVLKNGGRNVENTESELWNSYGRTRFAQDVPWLKLFVTIRDCQR